jgi:hypothetical protein
MSTIITGKKQNEIAELADLSRNLYENLFNVNLIEDSNTYFYNILNKVIFPDDISDELIDEITLMSDKPWTMLSFQLYGTIDLWWVVYLLNKPDYIFKAQANTTYKFIKADYITNVLSQITVID